MMVVMIRRFSLSFCYYFPSTNDNTFFSEIDLKCLDHQRAHYNKFINIIIQINFDRNISFLKIESYFKLSKLKRKNIL